MRKYTVYSIDFPNGYKYYGITGRKFSVRKAEHCCPHKEKKNHFHNSIRFYKKDLIWTILHEGLSEIEAKDKEIEYIASYDKKDMLFNSTPGGNLPWNTGLTGFKPSPESVKKQVESRKGYKHSEETKNKISVSNMGKVVTKDVVLKSIKSKGAIPLEVYNLKGEYIGTWDNKSECSRTLGLLNNKIHDCLNGVYYSHRGYRFKLNGMEFPLFVDGRTTVNKSKHIAVARKRFNAKIVVNDITNSMEFLSLIEFRQHFKLTRKVAYASIKNGNIGSYKITKISN